MRTLTSLACISALALLTGCATEGYYDNNGNYVPPANATSSAQRSHSPNPGHEGTARPVRYDDNYRTPYAYERAGYYDYNGYYIARNDGLNVPDNMFPPRGMCRVWFTERAPSEQPGVESCDGIRSRVPAGAYVIYGG